RTAGGGGVPLRRAARRPALPVDGVAAWRLPRLRPAEVGRDAHAPRRTLRLVGSPPPIVAGALAMTSRHERIAGAALLLLMIVHAKNARPEGAWVLLWACDVTAIA